MEKAIYSTTYSSFLAWLKAGRARKGLTIRQLAELLGESSAVVGKIETGDRRLDIYEFCQYCEVLGLDPSEGLAILQTNQRHT